MGLETLYQQVREAISRLDFHEIWPGFAPLKFALYDTVGSLISLRSTDQQRRRIDGAAVGIRIRLAIRMQKIIVR